MMAQCTTAVSFVQATTISPHNYNFHGFSSKPKLLIQCNKSILFANFQRNGLSSSWQGNKLCFLFYTVQISNVLSRNE